MSYFHKNCSWIGSKKIYIRVKHTQLNHRKSDAYKNPRRYATIHMSNLTKPNTIRHSRYWYLPVILFPMLLTIWKRLLKIRGAVHKNSKNSKKSVEGANTAKGQCEGSRGISEGKPEAVKPRFCSQVFAPAQCLVRSVQTVGFLQLCVAS